MATVIRPFSFREALRYFGEEPAKEPARWTRAERSRLEKRFREYLAAGGFPRRSASTPALRIELLQGYVDTVLFRDVVERYGVSQVAALRWLVRQCLRNPASSFSIHKLHLDLKAQGLGIAKDAVRPARPPARRLPAQLGAAGHRIRAPAQLESAQALPDRRGDDRRFRRQRPRQPRARARNRGLAASWSAARPSSAT